MSKASQLLIDRLASLGITRPVETADAIRQFVETFLEEFYATRAGHVRILGNDQEARFATGGIVQTDRATLPLIGDRAGETIVPRKPGTNPDRYIKPQRD